ncbi:MAG: DUF547 domain-containing protein [Candidatus Omnitrophica bacterium]|nr:DUF547 domain-containing protein [Candidatus Omnitrophota bacterium]
MNIFETGKTRSPSLRHSKTIFFLLLLSFICSPITSFADPAHYLFTALLSEHVKDGLVDYTRLCNDGRFLYYIDQLKNTDPDTLDHNQQLAFWLNAYNAYTLKIVCEHYPIKSINNLHLGGLTLGTVLRKTIWDRDFVVINNQPTTLHVIEHDILRGKFYEPRIHFALVCAAKSCPPLRDEAYEADFIEYQLNDQGRRFLADHEKNRFDTEKKIAFLSKIFDWFSKDFGDTKAQMLTYLSRFLPAQIAETIQEDISSWRIKHLKYDWRLNELKQ